MCWVVAPISPLESGRQIIFLFKGPYVQPGLHCEDEIISKCHERGTKRKAYVLNRIQTCDLPNTGWALYPLSYGEPMKSEAMLYTRFLLETRPVYSSLLLGSYYMVKENTK